VAAWSRRSSSSACAATRRWNGDTGHGSARAAAGSSAAAKESVRTTEADLVVAAYIAGQQVPLSETERNAALRRALFVFAAGGDLHRDPTFDDPAVVELAADLDSPERRQALIAASDLLERLGDPDLAWRAYACGLLADALGEE
jgi:hypothetical protein